jgi:hypothetical protein
MSLFFSSFDNLLIALKSIHRRIIFMSKQRERETLRIKNKQQRSQQLAAGGIVLVLIAKQGVVHGCGFGW